MTFKKLKIAAELKVVIKKNTCRDPIVTCEMSNYTELDGDNDVEEKSKMSACQKELRAKNTLLVLQLCRVRRLTIENWM